MPKPLVSIVTPSFNQAAFLGDTLRSVADQDYQHIEHIVMDGGSTDGSVELIEEHARHHPVEWRSEPDDGQADAIQRGLSAAHGDVVGWLNSDDVYLDERVISDVVRKFREGAQVVTGGGWYIDEAGERFRHIAVQPNRLDYSRLRCVDWALQPATFLTRSLFLELGLDTSLDYAFDWDLYARASMLTPIVAIERDIAGYRIHGGGKTYSGGYHRHRELLAMTARYSGKGSIRYLTLAAVTAVHGVAEQRPGPLAGLVVRGANVFTRLTNEVTRGRGIPY